MTDAPASHPTLPCVVQLGFAGSRQLLPPGSQNAALDAQIQAYLAQQLDALPTALGLSPSHFLCGISQIAIGADTLFTHVCKERNLAQWIFLPQPREEYLTAVASNNKPDFTDDERRVARELLDSPHIILERVVGHAPDRHARFEDVNLEIVRASDVVICLLRADAEYKPGGTEHLLDLAKKRGRPALELRVGWKDGKPDFTAAWHNRETYQPPRLPEELKDLPLPSAAGAPGAPTATAFRDAVKTFASAEAEGQRTQFHYAAFGIIFTHLLATLLAAGALAIHAIHDLPLLLALLLFAELVLLAGGFGVHQYLHHSHAVKRWALSRLIAETTRSLRAIGNLHLYLDYLFWLPFPARLQPLLRTLNVLHLRSTRPSRDADWKPLRDSYVAIRLDDEKKGQIPYYRRELKRDQRRLSIANATFFVCSLFAILATGIKLVVTLGETHLCSLFTMLATAIKLGESNPEAAAWLPGFLGLLAIVLPVMAVGALSYTAAMDTAARVHTYAETLQFLEKEHRPLLQQTESPREFATLVLETVGSSRVDLQACKLEYSIVSPK